jgi:hypothetical protein
MSAKPIKRSRGFLWALDDALGRLDYRDAVDYEGPIPLRIYPRLVYGDGECEVVYHHNGFSVQCLCADGHLRRLSLTARVRRWLVLRLCGVKP